MTSLFRSLPCHPSLRSRLEHDAFDGFEIEDATGEFTTEEIEFALYGKNANYSLTQEVIAKFAKKYPLELVQLQSWMCSGTQVGLWLLRLEGAPLAVVWRAKCTDERALRFLDHESLKCFREKWEAVKAELVPGAIFVSDDALDMPIHAPDGTGFDISSYSTNDGLPRLTAAGAVDWIEAEGGLDQLHDLGALRHAHSVMSKTLSQIEGWLAYPTRSVKETGSDPQVDRARTHRDDLAIHLEAVSARIRFLSLAAPTA